MKKLREKKKGKNKDFSLFKLPKQKVRRPVPWDGVRGTAGRQFSHKEDQG